MGCTIVVGGQYGSEGKGKVVANRVRRQPTSWVVRCGGPNSGHTISVRGKETIVRQIPAGVDQPSALLLLSAGCAIDEGILLAEADALEIDRERVIVDPRAVLITPADRERELSIGQAIASTASGTGAALMRRMARGPDVNLAGSSERIRQRFRVQCVAELVHDRLERGGRVIIEGTQGFGLSLLHGGPYPFVTARDTTASAFAAEVGVPLSLVDEVVLVLRTFPIRVGGASGPLQDEIDWDQVAQLSRAPTVLPELTSVTRKVRRVARFDMNLVVRASRYNRPTSLAVMGLDRLDYANHLVQMQGQLTPQAQDFLKACESGLGAPVELIGTGFRTLDLIDLKSGA